MDLFLSQASDLFRIGLLVALIYTTFRTAAATGTVMPLILGAIFVAVIIPTTRGAWNWTEIGVGLVTNAVLLTLGLAALALFRYVRRL